MWNLYSCHDVMASDVQTPDNLGREVIYLEVFNEQITNRIVCNE